MTSDSIILLNDNIDPETPGDVAIFATEDTLCHHLELWFVDQPHLALQLDGTEVRLACRGNEVYVLEKRPYPGGEQIVKVWLQSIPDSEARKLPNDVLTAIGRV